MLRASRAGPVFSIGVITVDDPKYEARRAEQRLAWADEARRIGQYVRFTIRCGAELYGPPTYTPTAACLRENATHGDMVCTSVPYDAGRLKGPSLLVVAWFEHVLATQPDSQYVASVDDDVFLHVRDLVHLARSIPTTSYVYMGNIVGWSFDNATYNFWSFGWKGGQGLLGPFPFAVGSFLAMNTPLASTVVAATRGDVQRVHGLPRNHSRFFQDAFIGSAIHRLVKVSEPVAVYNLFPIAWDSDGFRVAPSDVIWHNRHKVACRVQCLGSFSEKFHCGARPRLNFTWRPRTEGWARAINQPGMTQYAVWEMGGFNRPPENPALGGEAARVNGSCRTAFDLRNPATISAFNLSSCQACLAALGKHKRKG